MTTNSKPYLIKGNQHIDERGTLSFINDFDMSAIKRMYTIHHSSTNVVRAWQGHQIESKHFKCQQGKFLISIVKIDNWENPSVDLEPEIFILTSGKTEILYIPCGYANGFKALEENSELIVFSNLDLESAKGDQYRFDGSLWMNWVDVQP